MEKRHMCLSREEQDSINALKGTAAETVEMAQSLYSAVVHDQLPVDEELSVLPPEAPTKRALATPLIPRFEEAKLKD